MKHINDALQLTTKAEIEIEINIRKELRAILVGSLYPGILTDEIYKLTCKYEENNTKTK